LREIISKHSEIKSFILWGSSETSSIKQSSNYLIKPYSPEGEAFKKIRNTSTHVFSFEIKIDNFIITLNYTDKKKKIKKPYGVNLFWILSFLR
jgi:hypothetical protein